MAAVPSELLNLYKVDYIQARSDVKYSQTRLYLPFQDAGIFSGRMLDESNILC